MPLYGWMLPALLLGADPDAGEPVTPRLEKGQEVVWRGTFDEDLLRPGVRTERTYDWEGRLLVLERTDTATWAVLLTTLRLQPGPKAKGPEPTPVVHVELVTIAADGKVGLLPAALLTSPAARAEPSPLPVAPLDGLPLREAGMFLEVPGGRAALGQTWDVAEKGRPFRAWTVEDTEPHKGARCLKVIGTQQTPGWTVPRGNEACWQRIDTVWLSANGYAARFERLVERREPETQEINLRTKLTAEQVQRMHLPRLQFEDTRAEAVQALQCGALFDQIAREPSRASPDLFDALLRRIATHESAHPAGDGNPFREALLTVRRRAEAARRGNLPPTPAEEPNEPAGRLVAGRPAPDFAAPLLNGMGQVRLYRLLGQPVVLFYYQPGDNTEAVLRAAERLHIDPDRRCTVLAIALGDETAARKQASEFGLTVPVVGGRDLRQGHGIESTPQVAVLDDEGAVRRIFVGWGAETAEAVRREVAQWAK